MSSFSPKVEFGERLPAAIFELVNQAISTDDLLAAAGERKSAHEAEVAAEIKRLPAAQNLATLKNRLELANQACAKVQREIEQAEASLTDLILRDDSASLEAARGRLQDALVSQHIKQHERHVLREAIREHTESLERDTAELRRKAAEEYKCHLQAEVNDAIERLRPILASPQVYEHLGRYAVARVAGAREQPNYIPPTRAPWNQPAPAPVVVG